MRDTATAWAYEHPELHPHDPAWRDIGRAECARLAEILAPWLADGVEHVGSTAVPGLAAKPVLDLMASVREPDAVVKQAGARPTTAKPIPMPRRNSSPQRSVGFETALRLLACLGDFHERVQIAGCLQRCDTRDRDNRQAGGEDGDPLARWRRQQGGDPPGHGACQGQ
jgi:GrpB-like predicted nucleotidyltransferase (UPF0157 family)